MQVVINDDVFLATCMAVVLGFPLLSFLINVLIPSRYGWVSSLISPLFVLVSLIFAIVVFVQLPPGQPFIFKRTWFEVAGFTFSAGFLLNQLSLVLMLAVCVISFLVHLYSVGYMAGDQELKRYFSLLGLFTCSMLGIILANDLLVVFACWELVGFCSYVLIGHWSYKPEAASAARKAFLFNRIGDAGFVISLMMLLHYAGTLGFEGLKSYPFNNSQATIASLFLFCGIAGKSAQFPLFSWLPDAMTGPTPVSALIHAATMVAAGVFLLARMFFLFTPDSLQVVAITGAVTAMAGSILALGQFDLKKILAYSTISQLGLMVLSMGAGLPDAAVLHLVTHASFKACLFLASGALVYSLEQAQRQAGSVFDPWDLRNLGGLYKRLPLTFMCFLLAGLSLSGIPFTSGFLSKEAILNGLINSAGDLFSLKWFLSIAALITGVLTIMYVFRLIWFVFFGKPRVQELTLRESPAVMKLPVLILALLSLFPSVSLNPMKPEGWIFQSESAEVSWLYAAIMIITALVLSYLFFVKRKAKEIPFDLTGQSRIIDRFYGATIGAGINWLSRFSASTDKRFIDGILHAIAVISVTLAHLVGWFDRAVLDRLLVGGTTTSIRMTGQVARSFQAGKIQHYIFWSIFGIIILLFWVLV